MSQSLAPEPLLTLDEQVAELRRELRATRREVADMSATLEIVAHSLNEIGKAVGVERSIKTLASAVQRQAARRRKK